MSYCIRSKVWIVHNDKMLIGDGRAKLLDAIHRTGSLSKAASELKISYKKAWKLIKSINENGQELAVVGNAGGSGGGGTQLTPYGLHLLGAFNSINESCWKHLNDKFCEFHNP